MSQVDKHFDSLDLGKQKDFCDKLDETVEAINELKWYGLIDDYGFRRALNSLERAKEIAYLHMYK